MFIPKFALAALCLLVTPAFGSPADPDAPVPAAAPFPSLLRDPTPLQNTEQPAPHGPAEQASPPRPATGHGHHHPAHGETTP